MHDDDLTRSLADSMRRRVQGLERRPDAETLITRLEHRARRRRQALLATAAAVVVAATIGAFLLGRSTGGQSAPAAIVALDDGTPQAAASPTGGYVPANVEAAKREISDAFHAAYTGGLPDETQLHAIQDGAALAAPMAQSRAVAERFGYTPEQLAGTTVRVLDTSFIDDTHAIVHFTLTVPDHGAILVDRIGYAVSTNGRWQVALRTACDLLSLGGIGSPCPPSG